MWKYQDIDHINIEISSLCNSVCAWCPRYENMSSVVNKQLNPTYVTIDQFKQWFTPELISRVKHWTYSGDYGDACTNPDLIKIFEYTFEHNENTSVQVNTNGGMKTPNFWQSLGELFSKKYDNRKIIFSIDGLEDTNHLYRRNVKWNKIIENTTAYIEAGGKAEWEFLIFKHNQHQVDEVISLAKRMNFHDIRIKYPRGFEKGNMKVRDENFNVLYELEPIDESFIQHNYAELNGVLAEDIQYENFKETIEKHFSKEEGDIECFSHRSGVEIRITADGLVYPCVHFGHVSKHPRENHQVPKAQLIDIMKDKEISLKDRSLSEILEDDPYNWIYNSWKNKSCLVCWLCCGASKDKKTIMQEIYQKENKIHGTT